MRLLVFGVLVLMFGAPAAGQARSLSVELPRSLLAGKPIAVTWSGETGPQDVATFGGFVVDIYLRSGAGRCPAERTGAADRKRVAGFAPQGVRLAGPLRGAAQTVVARAGRYRLCGYVSKPGPGPIRYERFVDRGNVSVRAGRGASRPAPDPKPGTYVASAAQIVGGGTGASLQLTIADGQVQSVAATGVLLSRCSDGVTPSNPLLNSQVDIASTGPAEGLGSELRGSRLAVSLPGPQPSGVASLDAGFRNGRELRGVFYSETGAGVCAGTFAFTARR